MNIEPTKLKITAWSLAVISSLLLYVALISIVSNFASATSGTKTLSSEDYNKFSSNQIFFYTPADCVEGSSTGVCGDDAKEIYWSALREYTDDEIKIAGIVGNLANEGGMNPAAWEGSPSAGGGGIDSDGELVGGWDAYYNGDITRTGLGAFQITSGLDQYLKYTNDNAPELVKYFKDTKEYSYNWKWHPGCEIDSEHSSYGDCLLEKIGASEFGKLVDFELEYALGDNFKPGTTQDYMDSSFATPSDAAYWWAQKWEIGADYQNPRQSRLDDAEKAYDDYRGFSCSISSDSETCSKLSELRTKMWTGKEGTSEETLQRNRERFMNVVMKEQPSIAGVEGYMNQVLAFNSTYNDGEDYLSNWLNRQCPSFVAHGDTVCYEQYKIGDEEAAWINEALNGSNHIRLATGNASGGSKVGVGKIVCVWDKKNSKCRDDVDYSKAGGKGDCATYSVAEDGEILGECWGIEDRTTNWAEEMAKSCGSSTSSSTSDSSKPDESSTTSNSDESSSSNSSSPDITLIGDSISVASENEIKEKFPNSFLSMVVSRHPIGGGTCSGDEGGLALLKHIIQGYGQVITQHVDGSCEALSVGSDSLKNNIIWELGTNQNGANEATIEEVVELVDDKNLYLVTPYNGDDIDGSEAIAQMYRNIASEHDNVYIVDWAEAVKDNESTYVTRSDGMAVHPTDEGKKLLASLINEAVNGGSGCAQKDFVFYGQCDPKWANDSFGSDNICSGGCGPAVFAMFASMLLGREITPAETSKVAGDGGQEANGAGAFTTMTQYLANYYNLEYEDLSSTPSNSRINVINSHLDDGWLIVTAGKGSFPYTSNGHYVGIRGKADGGNWLIADPGKSEDVSTNNSYDPNDIIQGMTLIYAIRGSSDTGCDNVNYCSGNKGTTGTSGFSSVEDAQFIIDEYNNDSLSAYSLAVPGTGDKHHNCVAFSVWFINHFTEIPHLGGITGDGRDFVDYFISRFGGDYPDLSISYEPSVYSVASWSVSSPGFHSSNHTGIVIGINKAKGKIIIAEAGWNNPNSTGIHEWDLSEATGTPQNGWRYVNLNKYLKPKTGLK